MRGTHRKRKKNQKNQPQGPPGAGDARQDNVLSWTMTTTATAIATPSPSPRATPRHVRFTTAAAAPLRDAPIPPPHVSCYTTGRDREERDGPSGSLHAASAGRAPVTEEKKDAGADADDDEDEERLRSSERRIAAAEAAGLLRSHGASRPHPHIATATTPTMPPRVWCVIDLTHSVLRVESAARAGSVPTEEQRRDALDDRPRRTADGRVLRYRPGWSELLLWMFAAARCHVAVWCSGPREWVGAAFSKYTPLIAHVHGDAGDEAPSLYRYPSLTPEGRPRPPHAPLPDIVAAAAAEAMPMPWDADAVLVVSDRGPPVSYGGPPLVSFAVPAWSGASDDRALYELTTRLARFRVHAPPPPTPPHHPLVRGPFVPAASRKCAVM
jgi:hypothetical protein